MCHKIIKNNKHCWLYNVAFAACISVNSMVSMWNYTFRIWPELFILQADHVDSICWIINYNYCVNNCEKALKGHNLWYACCVSLSFAFNPLFYLVSLNKSERRLWEKEQLFWTTRIVTIIAVRKILFFPLLYGFIWYAMTLNPKFFSILQHHII